MQSENLIIGGGVIGLMTAYMLIRAGREVTVIDRGRIENSTSFGNAGLLSAFEKSPLSAPGVVSKTLKLMLKGQSPMFLNPTPDPHIYRWILNFVKNANEERLKKTLALFEKYGEIAMGYYREMQEDLGLDLDFHREGLLMVYTLQESFDERRRSIEGEEEEACEEKYSLLTPSECRNYLPLLNDRIAGGILLKRNGHLDPGRMMRNLKAYLEGQGVRFILEEEIVDWELKDHRVVAAIGKKGRYPARNLILSNGADRSLAKQLGRDLMMTPAKGYSITFGMEESLKPRVPALFNDLFIACTPRRNDVRLTSKLELGSRDPRPLQKRIDSFLNHFREYTRPFEMHHPETWAGFRPLTPNDRPLVGREARYPNLIYATGLGWLGITMGPAVGEMVADLILREAPDKKSDDILLFSGFWQG